MKVKKTILFMAAVYVLFILITIFSFSSDIKHNAGNISFAMGQSNMQAFVIDQNSSVALDSENDILIKSVIAEVNVKFEKRTDIKVHAYGEIKINSEIEPELITEKSGNTINIYLKTDKINNNMRGKLTYDILVPFTFKNNLQISNISGNTFLDGNNMKLTGISSENVSGDTNLKNLECGNFSVESVSGSIYLAAVIADKAKFKNVSGDIKAEEFRADTNGSSVSGDIRFQISSLEHNYYIETVSGSITAVIPGNSQFILKGDSVSGDINCREFAIMVTKKSHTALYGHTESGKYTLELETVSGDIDISRK
ncbi:MAG: DUF4097 family beta strand repeat protein [Spirochaetes bacterium]|nr:DUF4097 family beta strand repeat protein [Spirochaetota bacterium]